MDAKQLFSYARKFADKAEREGRGTQFPTVRQSARRFKVSQAVIADTVEGADCRDIPGADYLGLAVGRGVSGGGSFAYESQADYLIEAYRTTPEEPQG